MNSKRFWFNHHCSRGVPFLLAVMLLAMTTLPALAWNTHANPGDSAAQLGGRGWARLRSRGAAGHLPRE